MGVHVSGNYQALSITLRILKMSGRPYFEQKLANVAVVGGTAAVENCLLDRQKQPGKWPQALRWNS